ncbi:hypothetical protein D7X87_16010, partial [bacterium D16-54]
MQEAAEECCSAGSTGGGRVLRAAASGSQAGFDKNRQTWPAPSLKGLSVSRAVIIFLPGKKLPLSPWTRGEVQPEGDVSGYTALTSPRSGPAWTPVFVLAGPGRSRPARYRKPPGNAATQKAPGGGRVLRAAASGSQAGFDKNRQTRPAPSLKGLSVSRAVKILCGGRRRPSSRGAACPR